VAPLLPTAAVYERRRRSFLKLSAAAISDLQSGNAIVLRFASGSRVYPGSDHSVVTAPELSRSYVG